MSLTVEEKFTAVMLKLRNVRPFYSAIYSQLPKYEMPEDNYMQTIGVSSREIVYAKKFVEETPMEEFIFINMHEIAHFALLHPTRRGERQRIIFNIACDMYVNKLLCEELRAAPGETVTINTVNIKIPTNMIFANWVNTSIDTVESIYDKIRDDYEVLEVSGTEFKVYRINPDGTKTDVTDKIRDSIINGNGQDSSDVDAAKKIIIDAEVKSKLVGNSEGLLEREVKKAIAPKVDWRSICKKYLIDETSKESTFRTTDKRLLYQNAIFPGQVGYDKSKLERVKIAIDTSGSISDTDLGIFHAQVGQLLSRYKVGAEVIYWDTVISSNNTFSSKQEFERIKAVGGGGTNPECIFEYFDSKKCKVKPAFTLIFTDGFILFECKSNWEKKYKDTIWIIVPGGNTSFKQPFGTKVTFDRY